VDADLRSSVISGPAVEGLEAQPAGDLTLADKHPERSGGARVLGEPLASRIDRKRLEVCSGQSGWNGSVVDPDDCGQVVKNCIAYDQARGLPTTGPRRSVPRGGNDSAVSSPQPTISSALKKKPISRTAVSGESEPCTAFFSISLPRSRRIVPGAAL